MARRKIEFWGLKKNQSVEVAKNPVLRTKGQQNRVHLVDRIRYLGLAGDGYTKHYDLELGIKKRRCSVGIYCGVILAAMLGLDYERMYDALQTHSMAHYVVDRYPALAAELAQEIHYHAKEVPVVEKHGENRDAKLAQLGVCRLARSHYLAILGFNRRCGLADRFVEYRPLVLEIRVEKSTGDSALFCDHTEVDGGKTEPGEEP